MSILFYELKKIFSKRSVIVLLAVLLIADIVKIGVSQQKVNSEKDFYDGRKKLIDEVKGEFDSERTSFVIKRKNELSKLVYERRYSTQYNPATYTGYEYGDYEIFREVYNGLDYAYHYSENIRPVIEKAEKNLTLFQKGDPEYAFAEKTVKRYSERSISAYYDTAGCEEYFSYDFSTLLVLLFLLFALSPIFSEEKELGTEPLLLSTPRGKREVGKYKILTAVLVSVLTGLVFFVTDFLCFNVFCGLEGFSNPLYSIPDFIYTPFRGSIFEYILITFLMKSMGYILFCFVFLLLSEKLSKSLFSLLGSAAVIIALVIYNDVSSNGAMKMLSPLSVLIPRLFFESPESMFYAKYAVIVFVLLAAAVTLLLIYGLKKRKGASRCFWD